MSTLKSISSNSPSTLKFVTGNEVPSDLTSASSIQQTGYGTIGVYLSSYKSTVYIAPADKNDAVMYMPADTYDFLRGDHTGLRNCLKTIDLANLDTSKANVMDGMFYMLSSLETVNLGDHFDSSNVYIFNTMFNDCSSIKTLDLTKLNTSNATNLRFMFAGCTSLTTIKVSDAFVLDKVTVSESMFQNCTNLVSGAGTTYDASVIDATRAVIDEGDIKPGYFTAAS